MSRVLITRPWEDAAPLADLLSGLGHQPLVEPMLEILYEGGPVMLPDRLQGLLFTSANGVRAFERVCPRREFPVYAVGEATAAAARGAGFTAVVSASGDVTALARVVSARCDPAAGPFLHIAANAVAGDLAGQLAAAGFIVRRQTLYQARPARGLNPTTAAALAEGRIDSVLLFSPRTARSLVALIAAAGLVGECARIAALCLSPAVATAAGVAPLVWRALRVAARPDQAALIALLDG